jgi:DNA-binding NtrC family response regulator
MMNKSRKTRILVVDGERNWRDLIKEVLEKDGYEITTAESGGRAIELIDSDEFHLVITALWLEFEFKGIEVLEHVKEKSPITPVIILTIFDMDPQAKESMMRDAYHIFYKGEKEASNKELRNKVAEALIKRNIDEEEPG